MNGNVLVLDLTHGGEILAKEYAQRGCEVTAVDVYHTASEEVKNSLTSCGIEVLDAAPARTFDLGILPIHCPDSYIGKAKLVKRLTSHEAVGQLASFNFPTVEITGVWGKTSACHILAHILVACGKKVLLHTSRGRGIVSTEGTVILKDKVSIAPPAILDISKFELDVDIGIFEVSLGGTGLANIAAITSLGNNYAIAAGTKKAFDGKVQMIASARDTVVYPHEETNLWAPHVSQGVKTVTFGGGDVQLILPDKLVLGKQVRAQVITPEKSYEVKLQGSYLVPSYLIALSTALGCAYALKLDMDKAVSSLASFNGVPGRGEVLKEKGWYRIIERNPGVSAGSIAWNLKTLEDYYAQTDIGVALDPVNAKVCEKLDLKEVNALLSADNCVTGQYLMNMPGFDNPGFRRIDGFTDVRGKHATLMCCTKEGYL
ncbi:coenzyme F430 synthase [Candidatus Methanomassiliicoccus intestinalis]|uniref:coenzyme F430 synthase n=1 Tax=Candidatus Methanomassiliicoccus intestinalis TaxID=1406512 RepID=UPI0037DD6FD5